MTVIDPEHLVEPLAPLPLHMQVRAALENYFYALEGETPVNLYKLVLGEVEPPLLETVLRYTRGNQTKAAEILGINRSTLRKKLKQYGVD